MVVKFIWPSISISSICIPQGRRHVIRLCGSLVHSSLLQFVIKLWHRHFFKLFFFFVFCLFSNNHFKSVGLLGKHFNLCFIFYFFPFIRTQFSRDYGTFAFYHIEDYNWSLYCICCHSFKYILTLWANVPRYYSEILRKDIMVVDVWQLWKPCSTLSAAYKLLCLQIWFLLFYGSSLFLFFPN